jgi:hypothetical protein
MCYHQAGSGGLLSKETTMGKQVKVMVERHPDGYDAYPLGLKGIIVAEGGTYAESLADVKAAMTFHRETFGPVVFAEQEVNCGSDHLDPRGSGRSQADTQQLYV